MAKNATISYLVNNHPPDTLWQARTHNRDAPENRIPVPRLSWLVRNEEIAMDESDLIWMFRDSALDHATFFLDTCFVRKTN